MVAKMRRTDKDRTKAAFASRLRSIMDERGLSAAEMARRMREHLPEGTRASRATISHYRTARTLPRQPYLAALSLALGVDQSELLPILRANGPLQPAGTTGVAEAEPANSNAASAEPPRATLRLCIIEDCGEEAHLQINQRVPWPMALKILEALKVRQPTS